MNSVATVPATLITIRLSHYCEKARWALDRASLPYREEPHVPLLSRFVARRAAGGTVPVLIDGDLRLTESTDILRHVDSLHPGMLYPLEAGLRTEVESLESRFDQDLGTHVRRWAYAHLLPEKALLRELWSRGVPKREALWMPLILPVARKLLRRAYKVTPAGAGRSGERIRAVFAEVDARLKDGRRFLAGDRFSAADMTFAALAAPAVFAPECRAVMPTLDQVPGAMRNDVMSLRATGAGQFALRLYATERGVTRSAG
ncbi:MAG: glutathione S-transferase family protein [Pseudomonadota bacterium]